jgi:glucose-6-phosphate 1-dehydrogenase
MQLLFGQEMIQKQQLFYRHPFGQRLQLSKTIKEYTKKILKVDTILKLNHYLIGISMIYSNTK